MSTYVYPPVTISTAGLATEAKQDAQIVILQQIEDNTDGLEALATSGNASLTSIDGKVLTDTQLRASPVPVSGPLTNTQLRATPVDVLGPLTNTELRASAVPVSAASLPLPTGASTSANQATEIASLASIDSKIIAADTDNVTVVSSALPTGASTSAAQTTGNSSLSSIDSKVLTDTQLRASPVPVSGTVSTNGLTDAELRASPVAVDGSGVVQPVSATNLDIRDLSSASDSVAAAQSGTWNITNVSGTVSLPAGAATAANQSTEIASLASIDGKVPANLTVTSTRLLVDGSGVTQPVSAASLPLPSGASTSAAQTTGNSSLSSIDGKVPANLTVTSTRLLVDGSGVTQPVSGPLTDTQLRATPVPVSGTVAATQSGTWTVQPGNTANTTPWLVKEQRSSTSTLSNVSSSATNVTLLASNANRLNAAIFNDSTQILYVKLGTTASTSSYTVQIAAGGYYELPTVNIYTGIIDGIWASANGNARVTELT